MQSAAQGQDRSDSLDRSDVFDLLSNERRRFLLRYLRDNDGVGTVRELSTHIAEAEYGLEAADLSYKQRKRVYSALHQTHLPRLERAGVVVHERDGTVRLEPAATALFDQLGEPTGRRRETVLAGTAALLGFGLGSGLALWRGDPTGILYAVPGFLAVVGLYAYWAIEELGP